MRFNFAINDCDFGYYLFNDVNMKILIYIQFERYVAQSVHMYLD